MSLPKKLEDFIGRYVDSIETLEILLQLQRSPETVWMAPAMESHLGMKSGTAEKRLESLARHGFAIRGSSSGYRYGTPDKELDATVAELAAMYAERRVMVVNTIFSENLARLRAFSNAFKVKSE
jgi:DNA-binding IclR family transcriptional regulator